MAVSGVRSSWLASATNCRIRSSDLRAASSDAARASKAVSIWASMLLSDRPSRPTSVRGSRSGTRRVRSPAAMAPAVTSISVSGRRLARVGGEPGLVGRNLGGWPGRGQPVRAGRPDLLPARIKHPGLLKTVVKKVESVKVATANQRFLLLVVVGQPRLRLVQEVVAEHRPGGQADDG